MERRMTPKVFVFTKMMADLLVTAQFLKSKADGLLAQGDKEGAKCLYAAFLKSYHRSIRPFLVLIRAGILCQDPKCAEYIYRIIELAFNVQLAVISASPLEFSMLDAIKLLEDFFRLFFRKFDNMLPQLHSETESNLRNAVHLDLLLKYPRFVGVDTIVKRLGNFLKVCPSDERLSHDLNLAKKLQAQAHVSQFSQSLQKSSNWSQDQYHDMSEAWQLHAECILLSSLTVFPCRPFTCASDRFVVPQSFEKEGWEPGNGPYQLSLAEQQAVHDLQDERGWPRSSFD